MPLTTFDQIRSLHNASFLTYASSTILLAPQASFPPSRALRPWRSWGCRFLFAITCDSGQLIHLYMELSLDFSLDGYLVQLILFYAFPFGLHGTTWVCKHTCTHHMFTQFTIMITIEQWNKSLKLVCGNGEMAQWSGV